MRAPGKTESGGRAAGFGRPWTPARWTSRHGRILYLEDVCVSFDGFRAINKLSLDIAPGELRCIIGPNGAGKTTMMDIITGKTRPDSGTVFFGSTIDLLRYKEAEIAGWASAASSRSRRCSSSSRCSRTWSWR
jgi:urea transport system ATP-binding protein